jgi:5-hydroxyisourate hydrolase-like protein (transthyretin family)
MRYAGIFCLCLCLASCSNSKYGDHPPYPVSGQVLVNGQPAKGVRLVFYPQGDWGGNVIAPQAWTEEDGSFVLETYSPKDGAPAGDYRVTAEWPAYRRGKDWGPDKFGNKYAKPETSGLTAHVENRSNKLPPFKLTISAAQAKKNEAVAARQQRPKGKNP